MAKVDKRSRYLFAGVNHVHHKGIVSTTSVGNTRFDAISSDIDTLYDYDEGVIPIGYAHRPDLISNLFYGTPGYWWLLMLCNGVDDPFQGFKTGDRILLPKIS